MWRRRSHQSRSFRWVEKMPQWPPLKSSVLDCYPAKSVTRHVPLQEVYEVYVPIYIHMETKLYTVGRPAVIYISTGCCTNPCANHGGTFQSRFDTGLGASGCRKRTPCSLESHLKIIKMNSGVPTRFITTRKAIRFRVKPPPCG